MQAASYLIINIIRDIFV